MEEKIKLIYPEEVGHYGSVTYRFMPGGVECEIIAQDESGFHKQIGFASVPIEHSDNYVIQGMARYALRKARLAQWENIEDETSNLIAAKIIKRLENFSGDWICFNELLEDLKKEYGVK